MIKYLISSAYIYPICPLSTNHARMFLFGDIIARYARMKWKNVFFPVASHFSGNTAHKIADSLKKYFLNSANISVEDEKVMHIYIKIFINCRIIFWRLSQILSIFSIFIIEKFCGNWKLCEFLEIMRIPTLPDIKIFEYS